MTHGADGGRGSRRNVESRGAERFERAILRSAVDPEVVMSKRSSEVLTVLLPPKLVREFEAIAHAEGRDRSELFREMFGVYLAYREVGQFETVQCYGAAPARAVGVTSEEDVVRLFADVRGVRVRRLRRLADVDVGVSPGGVSRAVTAVA